MKQYHLQASWRYLVDGEADHEVGQEEDDEYGEEYDSVELRNPKNTAQFTTEFSTEFR